MILIFIKVITFESQPREAYKKQLLPSCHPSPQLQMQPLLTLLNASCIYLHFSE